MIHYTPAALTFEAPHSESPAAAAWLLMASHSALLMMDVTASHERATPAGITELFEAVQGEAPVRVVLDTLTATGLRDIPPFVLAQWDADHTLHLLVRGTDGVVVGAEGGDERVDGSSVSTWVERRIAGSKNVRLGGSADAGVRAPHGLPELPLVTGVVWAAAARVELTGAAAVTGAAATSRVAVVTDAAPVTSPVSTTGAATVPGAAALPSEVAIVPISVEPAAAAPISVAPAAGEQVISAPPVAAPVDDDPLFEETVMRSSDEEGDRDDQAVVHQAGDHDGETIMSDSIAGLRAARSRGEADAPQVPESRELFLVLSTGAREPFTDTVIVGRSPSVSKVSSGRVPHLVTIPGDQDISRSHAQFTLEGDTVVVTDLHSRNGTSVVLPGKSPQLLRQGEPTAVLVGTVVDLGGGITVTVTDEA